MSCVDYMERKQGNMVVMRSFIGIADDELNHRTPTVSELLWGAWDELWYSRESVTAHINPSPLRMYVNARFRLDKQSSGCVAQELVSALVYSLESGSRISLQCRWLDPQ
jgi:hypothetical protein